mgnify:CR=1 FL=1
MTNKELLEAIRFTSGGVGVNQFKNTTDVFEFLKWYMLELLYLPKEKQEIGKKVINEIVSIFLEPVKIMSDFPNQKPLK